MSLTITLDARQLVRFLGNGERRWPEAAHRALNKVGELIFAASQAGVPVGKTSRLKGTTFKDIAPGSFRFGYRAPYSRVVHWRKAKHKTGRRLFVAMPLARGKRILGPEIAQAVQDAMDKS